MPWCDQYGMRIPYGQLIKHQRAQWRNRNTQMWWRRRYVVIASRCVEASFTLTVEEEAECIEEEKSFKYLGRMLNQSDNDWLAVRRNVGKACRVWSRLEKLLRKEGAEPRVSTMF